jgi:hypothetical protein
MRALAPSLRRPAKATPVDGRERRLRLGRLSPRGRIIYYFLSTVRRAEGQGLVRRPSQTPLEWEQQVAQGMPDAGDDMAGLTRAYLEAQYSDHPIGPQHEGTARTYWERLRRALRRRLMRANSASLHDGGG